MSVSYDGFLNWAVDRFGRENIKLHGDEICTHSVFTEDYKFHLWMNPSGGRNLREGGVYRCWYTNRKGSLISLVSYVDKITYEDAAELICNSVPFRVLEQQVHDFYKNNQLDVNNIKTEVPKKVEVGLPPCTFSIKELPENNLHRQKAESYLSNRKIPIDDFFVCISGNYCNRIIIPYYNKEGKLVFYNGRTLSADPKVPRYIKSESSQDEILYFKSWPKKGSKVYITEGEFDAYSLSLCGFTGTASGGKDLSLTQIQIIKDNEFIPVIAFDGDKEGTSGLKSLGDKLLTFGKFSKVFYVRVPKGFKDWNQLFQTVSIEQIQSYIKSSEKVYDGAYTDFIQFF